MRKEISLGVVGVFILVSVFTVRVFAGVVNLSNTPNRLSEYAFVMPFGDGKVMVVWDEKEGFYNLYYRIYSGSTWSSKTRIFNTAMNSQWPQLAKDSAGRIHMTWMEGTARSNRDIYYAYYYNGKWSGMQRVYASSWNSTWPRIGADHLDRPHIIWTHDLGSQRGDNDIFHRWKDGGGWAGPLDVSRSKGTISIHSNFYVRGSSQYALWMDGHEMDWNLHFSQKTASQWETPIHINPKIQGYWPGICADSYGNVHVLFSSLLQNVYYMNRINGEWSDWRVVSDGFHQRNFVYIDVDDNDILHGVWRQRQTGTYPRDNIYYASATSFGIWAKPERVSDGNYCKTPVVKPDNNGYVHIVWFELNDETETGDVYYTRVPAGQGGSAESPVAVIDYSPEFGKPPLKVLFDATGSYDPDGTVISYSWSFGDGESAAGAKLFHTFSRRGSYVITLTVKDNDGLPGVAQVNVRVSDPPVAAFTMTPDRGVVPLTVRFDASASRDPDGSIVLYAWDFGDNTTGTGKTVSHTFFEDGDYTVELEVFDNVGISSRISHILKVLRVYSPTNVSWSFVENRNLFFKEYLNEIRWEENPLNSQYGISIVLYNIYRRVRGTVSFEQIAAVRADTFRYLDRGLQREDENRFEYALTAVDSQGNESDPAGYLTTTGGERQYKSGQILKKIRDQ